MNANLNTLPLPSLSRYAAGCRRRRHAGPLELADRSLERFRQSAQALQLADEAPCADTIATVARTLTRQFATLRRAPCIRLRLRCLAGLQAMASEPRWELDAAPRQQIAQIAAYAESPHRLIPDAVPVIGGLDDALLVELAWPTLHETFRNYLHFRRARCAEAALRGVHPHALHFGRREWQQVREALDAAIARQRRQVFAGSFLPAGSPLFRIH